ncbi:MAG TPA: phosphoribosylformylglycinamidine synthase subunit PurS, partial [Methanobacterium sp.]|nr:phosphoribosylformylglycinamidine synthase subunit PurS [Methanobacterium sp.]
MRYDAEVKISLKKGMLNPEATTIEKALALLKYQVENTKTLQIIKFSIEGESEDIVRQEVDEMCQ